MESKKEITKIKCKKRNNYYPTIQKLLHKQNYIKENSLICTMDKIVLKDDFAFLYLSKELYSRELISATLLNYKEFANFELKELGKYFTLKITNPKEYTLKTIAKEFNNFLLAESFGGHR